MSDYHPERALAIYLELSQRISEGRLMSNDKIALAVSQLSEVPIAELKGKSRPECIATYRQVLMTLLYETKTNSLERVGTFVGGRDHGTVLHAKNKVKGWNEVYGERVKQKGPLSYDLGKINWEEVLSRKEYSWDQLGLNKPMVEGKAIHLINDLDRKIPAGIKNPRNIVDKVSETIGCDYEKLFHTEPAPFSDPELIRSITWYFMRSKTFAPKEEILDIINQKTRKYDWDHILQGSSTIESFVESTRK